MKLLLELELSKIKLRKYILISFFITIGMCYFTTLSLFALDSEGAKNYSKCIWTITAVTLDCYMMYAAILVTKIIIEEYTNKTVLSLFTYSISRYKLMLAKTILVILMTIISAIVTEIVCIDYLVIIEPHLNLDLSAFAKADLIRWAKEFGWSLVILLSLTLLIISIGFIKKSVQAVLLSVLVSMFVIQILISQDLQIISPFIGVVTLVLMEVSINRFAYKID